MINYSYSSAEISPCGRYRWTLTRAWNDGRGTVLFVMLNPSTANAAEDDSTIRRCVGFARLWGYERVTVANLFAFRATQVPDLIKAMIDGEEGSFTKGANRSYVTRSVQGADAVVAAWGNHGRLAGQGDEFRAWMRTHRPGVLQNLGLTESGEPRHPLYLPRDARLESDQ